jgi:phosphotransacetylase
VLDGPLALDNAICPEAAAIKHIESSVARRVNLLVVPDLEAGNFSWLVPTPPALCWWRGCRSC